MSSTAFDVTALVKALEEATGFITSQYEPLAPGSANTAWNPINHNQPQKKLLDLYATVLPNLAYFPELQAWARRSAQELNAILAEHKLDIRLRPWEEEHQFGVVAIYDLIAKWLQAGAEVNPEGAPYKIQNKPAYRLSDAACRVQFWDIGEQYPLIRIPTQIPGDHVCIIYAPDHLEQFELLESVNALRSRMLSQQVLRDWNGAVLPNVLFDQKVDISWLLGLWCREGTSRHIWKIVQALMQVKFALGPEGARGKVGVAVSAAREAFVRPQPERNYVVDHDFYLWIERKGFYSGPLLSCYFTTSDFADRTIKLDEI